MPSRQRSATMTTRSTIERTVGFPLSDDRRTAVELLHRNGAWELRWNNGDGWRSTGSGVDGWLRRFCMAASDVVSSNAASTDAAIMVRRGTHITLETGPDGHIVMSVVRGDFRAPEASVHYNARIAPEIVAAIERAIDR